MALKHLVMMRLQPGVFTAEAEREYQETYEALKKALPEDIFSVRVVRNVVDRPQNMTVLVEMVLKDETSLPRYLQHPLHRAIGEKYNPFVAAIASFDSRITEEKTGE